MRRNEHLICGLFNGRGSRSHELKRADPPCGGSTLYGLAIGPRQRCCDGIARGVAESHTTLNHWVRLACDQRFGEIASSNTALGLWDRLVYDRRVGEFGSNRSISRRNFFFSFSVLSGYCGTEYRGMNISHSRFRRDSGGVNQPGVAGTS